MQKFWNAQVPADSWSFRLRERPSDGGATRTTTAQQKLLSAVSELKTPRPKMLNTLNDDRRRSITMENAPAQPKTKEAEVGCPATNKELP